MNLNGLYVCNICVYSQITHCTIRGWYLLLSSGSRFSSSLLALVIASSRVLHDAFTSISNHRWSVSLKHSFGFIWWWFISIMSSASFVRPRWRPIGFQYLQYFVKILFSSLAVGLWCTKSIRNKVECIHKYKSHCFKWNTAHEFVFQCLATGLLKLYAQAQVIAHNQTFTWLLVLNSSPGTPICVQKPQGWKNDLGKRSTV